MSEEISPAIVVAIEIADPALADRLASLLGGVAGLRLARSGEAATVALVSRGVQAAVEPADIDLTPRERDVLLLMAKAHRTRPLRDSSEYPFTPQIPRRLAARQA